MVFVTILSISQRVDILGDRMSGRKSRSGMLGLGKIEILCTCKEGVFLRYNFSGMSEIEVEWYLRIFLVVFHKELSLVVSLLGESRRIPCGRFVGVG